MKINKKTILNVFVIFLWVSIGSGIVVLLVSAVKKEQSKLCKEVIVEFKDDLPFRMLDETEIEYTLWPEARKNNPVGKQLVSLDLFSLEKQLEKNPWILDADLYIDQLNKLHLRVEQRNPVARLFTPEGNSFYIDEKYALLPVKLSDVISLPVFTNFYINPSLKTASDSVLLKRIVGLSKYIKSDSFWMAQVEQVNINANQTFEVTTQMGDQLVQLGVRSDWQKLFSKLKVLYGRMSEEGNWSKYIQIDLQYKDQAVCIKRESNYKIVDSIAVVDTILKTPINTQKNPVNKTL
jgi:cell division protein FtsQ